MLENIRFNAGEELNDKEFAKKLSNLGDLYVNDAFSVSQYEMQVRVLCGLPFSDPVPLTSVVMLNVLGFEMENLVKFHSINELFDKTNAKLYMYGKDQIKHKRKLGHIIFTGKNIDDLIDQANFIYDLIKV